MLNINNSPSSAFSGFPPRQKDGSFVNSRKSHRSCLLHGFPSDSPASSQYHAAGVFQRFQISKGNHSRRSRFQRCGMPGPRIPLSNRNNVLFDFWWSLRVRYAFLMSLLQHQFISQTGIFIFEKQIYIVKMSISTCVLS